MWLGFYVCDLLLCVTLLCNAMSCHVYVYVYVHVYVPVPGGVCCVWCAVLSLFVMLLCSVVLCGLCVCFDWFCLWGVCD